MVDLLYLIPSIWRAFGSEVCNLLGELLKFACECVKFWSWFPFEVFLVLNFTPESLECRLENDSHPSLRRSPAGRSDCSNTQCCSTAGFVTEPHPYTNPHILPIIHTTRPSISCPQLTPGPSLVELRNPSFAIFIGLSIVTRSWSTDSSPGLVGQPRSSKFYSTFPWHSMFVLSIYSGGLLD
jgi:hypothetical protein